MFLNLHFSGVASAVAVRQVTAAAASAASAGRAAGQLLAEGISMSGAAAEEVINLITQAKTTIKDTRGGGHGHGQCGG